MGAELGWTVGKTALRREQHAQDPIRTSSRTRKNFSRTHREFNMGEAGPEMMAETGCVGPWWLCERNLHHPKRKEEPLKFSTEG